jgi:hypothetical protein
MTPGPHEPDPKLYGYLEPDQLSIDRAIPLPRARVGPKVAVALWALRIFVLIVSAMVIYTFVAQLN